MISQKPYLIRALYEWCNDNQQTPHLVVFVDNNTIVPKQYVKEDQIVLNIAFDAINNLTIGNDWITFQAVFSGNHQDIVIPTANVLGIFAKESSQGMHFELENYTVKSEETNLADQKTPAKSGLTLVK